MKRIEDYFPPHRFDYLPRVAVFRTHSAIKNGRRITVGRRDLQEIADTHNALFDRFGKAAPFSKGHTIGDGLKEEDQPDTFGNAVRFYVDKLPEEPDADFLFCTWVVPKSQRAEVERYTAISPEYIPSKRMLWPIAALKSTAPHLDMPPIRQPERLRYSSGGAEQRLTIPLPYAVRQRPVDPHAAAAFAADLSRVLRP